MLANPLCCQRGKGQWMQFDRPRGAAYAARPRWRGARVNLREVIRPAARRQRRQAWRARRKRTNLSPRRV